MNRTGTVIAFAVLGALSGCANQGPGYSTARSPDGVYRGDCPSCGVVESVAVTEKDSGIGLGTLAGGVAGAVVGNQIGQGRGNTAATVAGAAGGAYAGHKLEEQYRGRNAVKFTVRMQDGSYQTVTQAGTEGFRVGDPVRVVNGRLERR